jgi:hypothetical protein
MPPHSEAQAWWADVQHVREAIERRRAGGVDPSAPLDVAGERRFARAASESLPAIDDLDWTSTSPARSGGRFGRSGRPSRSEPMRSPARLRGEDETTERPDVDAEAARLYEERATHDTGRASRATQRQASAIRAGRADDSATRARRADDTAPGAAGADPPTPPATTTSPAGARAPASTALGPPPARRTVQITGRTVAAPALPRLVEVERRRPARRPVERIGPRPDRVALWAVLLAFFLILVAATSSHAATPSTHAVDSAAVALHAPAR